MLIFMGWLAKPSAVPSFGTGSCNSALGICCSARGGWHCLKAKVSFKANREAVGWSGQMRPQEGMRQVLSPLHSSHYHFFSLSACCRTSWHIVPSADGLWPWLPCRLALLGQVEIEGIQNLWDQSSALKRFLNIMRCDLSLVTTFFRCKKPTLIIRGCGKLHLL